MIETSRQYRLDNAVIRYSNKCDAAAAKVTNE